MSPLCYIITTLDTSSDQKYVDMQRFVSHAHTRVGQRARQHTVEYGYILDGCDL